MPHALVPAHGTMKKWFTSVRAWRAQRKLRSLAAWEQERAKGKPRFVVRMAMKYSLLLTAAQDFLNYGLDGEAHFSRFLYNAIFYFIGGLFVGYVAWWDREKNYQNTLREIRVETIAAGATPPDNRIYEGKR